MIAIFDSGFGGLAIMKEILKILPEYDYLYLGDNARTPYGNRSKETVLEFTKEAVDFLFTRWNSRSDHSTGLKKDISLILIACNSATGLTLHDIQEQYLRNIKTKKILGVTRPVAEKAAEISKSGRIGVVGTKGTINSQTFEKEFEKINKKAKVYGQACPLLVPFIEEGWHKKPEAKMILRKYLRPLKDKNIDTLILGCTHYPLMFKEFEKIMGKNIKVLNSGKIVAESLKDYLKRHPEIEKKLTKKGKRIFITTDDPKKFKELGEEFLGQRISKVEKVEL